MSRLKALLQAARATLAGLGRAPRTMVPTLILLVVSTLAPRPPIGSRRAVLAGSVAMLVPPAILALPLPAAALRYDYGDIPSGTSVIKSLSLPPPPAPPAPPPPPPPPPLPPKPLPPPPPPPPSVRELEFRSLVRGGELADPTKLGSCAELEEQLLAVQAGAAPPPLCCTYIPHCHCVSKCALHC